MAGPGEIDRNRRALVPVAAGAATQASEPAPVPTERGHLDGSERDRRVSLDARSPLDGAFTGQATAPGARRPPWAGPVLDAEGLTEASEREILRAHGGRVTLGAYGDFDARRPPVVLVHGINGAPDTLRAVAERLRDEGKQVLIAFYDDRGTGVPESGAQLARALQGLRRHYPTERSLEIIGHSMGGIVARSALNSLAQPSWNGEDSEFAADPRAGFGQVQLRTVDTSWAGFQHEPDFVSFLRPVIRFFMKLFGWRAAFDMRGNSEMYHNLYRPRLEGVEIHDIAARQEEPDAVTSLPDLSEAQAATIARFVLSGEEPSDPRTRNMALGLAQDQRFEALRAELRRLEREGHAAGPSLIEAYERIMPRIEGSHTSILTSPELFEQLSPEPGVSVKSRVQPKGGVSVQSVPSPPPNHHDGENEQQENAHERR